jgi:hypothetical protein
VTLGQAGAQDGADRAAGGVVMPAEVLGQAADQVEAVAALGRLLARAAVTDDRPLGGSLIGDCYPDAEQPPGDLHDDEPAGLPESVCSSALVNNSDNGVARKPS